MVFYIKIVRGFSGFERRRLRGVASAVGQTCFAGSAAKAQLHFDDGTWPSGKALGSGPSIVGSNPTVPAKSYYVMKVCKA